MEKNIVKRLISEVNSTLSLYKKGGWIDVRRTPTSGPELMMSLEQFIEARFNREAWAIPEFNAAEELLGGHLFKCELEGPDEMKKRYKKATLTLIDEKLVLDPTQNLIDELEKVRQFIGGTKIMFNGVRVKIKYEIE